MSPTVEELGATADERIELAVGLLHSVSDGYVYTEDSVIRLVNTAMCRLTGLAREDLLGSAPPMSFWRPEDTERNLALVRQAIADGGAYGVQVVLQRASGEQFPAEIDVFGVHRADGTRRGFVTTVRDVSQRQAERAALAASEERFRLIVDNSPIGVAVLTADGEPVQVNPALCTMLGRAEAAVFADWPHLSHPEDRGSDATDRQDLLAGRIQGYQFDRRYLRPDGTVVWAEVHVALTRTSDGHDSRLIAQLVDVTQRRELEQQLSQLASTDPLTGLPNRRTWESALEQALQTGDGTVAVGIMDLDHFKAFNDAHGHPAGDELLSATSAAWRERLAAAHPGSLIARLGGEEFGIMLVGAGPARARTIAQQLLADVTHDQHASCGLTLFAAGDDRTSIMARADAALYTAKRSGRGRVVTLVGADERPAPTQS